MYVGTGKTTVARLFAQLLNDIGLLATNTCVETKGMEMQGVI